MVTYTITLKENEPAPRNWSRSKKSKPCHPLYYLPSKMQPGQSFTFPTASRNAFPRLRSIIQTHMKSQWNNAEPPKFMTRTVENNVGLKKLWIKRIK